MENSLLKRGNAGTGNFNNMTDEELAAWHTAFRSEAQRENYVNHNLEIVRHYRTEAIARAPAFDLERNAIDAAIARHGLSMSHSAASSSSAAAGNERDPASVYEEVRPPPMRRPRLDLPPPPPPSSTLPDVVASTSGSSRIGSTGNYGHYVALAHIFSDSFHGRAQLNALAARAPPATPPPVPPLNPAPVMMEHANVSPNNNIESENADLQDMAITKTIDSLGLRRT